MVNVSGSVPLFSVSLFCRVEIARMRKLGEPCDFRCGQFALSGDAAHFLSVDVL